MTRPSRLADEWASRIKELERLRESAPEWAWLWEIRLRVLRFLHSRYGHTPLAERRPAPPASSWIDPRPETATGAESNRPSQWMSRQEMREILDDIHEIASFGADDETEFPFESAAPLGACAGGEGSDDRPA